MYGELPDVEALEITASVEVAAEVEVRRLEGPRGLEIDAVRFRPSGKARASFIGINFHGNHTVSGIPNVPPSSGWCYPDGPTERGAQTDSWCVEALLNHGFELITFAGSDVLPDDAEVAKPELERLGEGSPLGAIGAWGWALACVARTFRGDAPQVLVGHSRMGKAALVAGGLCEAGDAVVSIQSGCGGAAPSRTTVGETVGDITRIFPHWFVPTFAKFAGREETLPFDQHALLALCAPRSVLLANASEDLWANPGGQTVMADLARPVYRLFDVSGGEIEATIRPGGHSVTPEDWRSIVDFVERLVLRGGG